MEHTPYHIPALLTETLDLLQIKPEGVYVDVTFGGGGHSREILNRLGKDGRLIGFDRDMDAYANVPDDPRFTFVHGDFRYLRNFLKYLGIEKVDGIVADLGVSFHHFDTPERGFSFRSDSPLDMRMNRGGEMPASKLLAIISEEDLRKLLRRHTDLKNTTGLAKAICAARELKPLKTTGELTEIVKPLLNPKTYKKDLAQVFQAIRIATNDEMSALEQLLMNSLKVLKKGGRIAVLTYHSGEDRMVKEFFKNGSFDDEPDMQALIYGRKSSPWKVITGSPIVAREEEVETNPRSRSAKLRVAEKVGN